MIKVDALPNMYNGKIYKNWNSVSATYGHNSLFAVKKTKNNDDILLITDTQNKNSKRVLYSAISKIIDKYDDNGNKTTFIYKDEGNKTIGKMIPSDSKNILIQTAEWVLENYFPKTLKIKLNPKHPASKVMFPVKRTSAEDVLNSRTAYKTIKEIHAQDFEGSLNYLPKKITLITDENEIQTINVESPADNLKIAKRFKFDPKSELGASLLTAD